MIPVPFILLFIRKVLDWMEHCRVGLFNRVADWLRRKADKNVDKITKYGFWGVCFFIAIPLPVTGAWTGSLVAATIKMNFWKALLSALLGALTKAVMNYSVSNFFTCRLRIKMSEKIGKIPIKVVDSTPNGEFISRMTNDVSIMGGSIHDIFGVIINGVIQLHAIRHLRIAFWV